MSDFYLGAGDTSSPFAETLKDSAGNPVDISGATVTLTVTPIKGGTPIINAAAMTNLQVGNGSDGSKGKVSYVFTAAQTATAGDYLAKIKTTNGSNVQTFPNAGYILITIGPAAPTTSGTYLTVEELKLTGTLTGTTFADSDAQVVIGAASRALDNAYGLYPAYWTLSPAAQTRYYTRLNDREVILDDAISVTSVALDYGAGDVGPGTYSTTLQASEYRLLPIQNGLASAGGSGEPFQTLRLSRTASQYFLPPGRDAIKLVGQYGYETVPAGVKAAATIIATRLLQRTRSAPFGVLGLGVDGGAIARAGQIARDPEIAYVMDAVSPLRIPV